MTGLLVTIAHRHRVPDALRVEIDFGRWCVALFAQGRFLRRISVDTELQARAEAERLERAGLRRLPDRPGEVER